MKIDVLAHFLPIPGHVTLNEHAHRRQAHCTSGLLRYAVLRSNTSKR